MTQISKWGSTNVGRQTYTAGRPGIRELCTAGLTDMPIAPNLAGGTGEKTQTVSVARVPADFRNTQFLSKLQKCYNQALE